MQAHNFRCHHREEEEESDKGDVGLEDGRPAGGCAGEREPADSAREEAAGEDRGVWPGARGGGGGGGGSAAEEDPPPPRGRGRVCVCE